MTVTFLTLALSFLAAPAPAPKLERPEAGKPPPRIAWITSAREGKFQLTDTEQKMVLVQRTVTEQVGGQEVKVTRTFMENKPLTVVRKLDVEKVRFYGVNGKQIETKEVRKLLTKDMPILLSADGKPVDRFYLRLAREGTLVLVVPPSAAASGMVGQPVPAQKLPPRPKPDRPRVERKEEAVPPPSKN